MEAILCVFFSTVSPQKHESRKGVAHLWKNKGVAPLRELLYNVQACVCEVQESSYIVAASISEKLAGLYWVSCVVHCVRF